jgi:sortase A
MKKKLPTIILIFIFLIGLSLLLYPSVADYWNTRKINKSIMDYSEVVSDINTADYEKMINDAVEYNEKLASDPNRFNPTEAMTELYNQCLNLNDTGMIGYVDIPTINEKIPIYHGTTDAVLDGAVGHMEGSSLPVGGLGTHCVISGHRGLPSARLFTDIDQLVEGDIFMINVLDETLTYEVDQILIVEPDETEALAIDPDQDYCTLVTCTPYGINTHRLLVRGHRIPNQSDGTRVTADAFQIDTMLVASLVAVPILLILLVILLVSTRKHSRKKAKKHTHDETEVYR